MARFKSPEQVDAVVGLLRAHRTTPELEVAQTHLDGTFRVGSIKANWSVYVGPTGRQRGEAPKRAKAPKPRRARS
jgi:hypothetical protein